MFTNTIFASIVITLATNWTGHTLDGRELGYVVTNRTLVINDPCNLHERRGILHVGESIELKAIPSDRLVWRPMQTLNAISVHQWTNIWWTNAFLHPVCP